MSSIESDILESRYNADAYAVSLLVKKGYIEYLSEDRWPKTKFSTFRITKKGQKLLDKNY
jgi:DNA-binding PadR family transcriptional regulator